MQRYSLGIKIETIFSDLLELTSEAQFSSDTERPALLRRANIKNDVLKYLLCALWQLGAIEEPNFLELTRQLEEVGRLLYGWKQKLASPPNF